MKKQRCVQKTTASRTQQTPSCGSSPPSPTTAETLPQRLRRATGLDLDLKAEAADEIDRLTALREEDGRAMSALIDGYQRMMRACIDGTVDKWHRDVMSAMSDEITRLRQVSPQENLTAAEREATSQVVAQTATSCGLTDAEREALEWLTHGDSPFPEEASRMATVRGLLERTK